MLPDYNSSYRNTHERAMTRTISAKWQSIGRSPTGDAGAAGQPWLTRTFPLPVLLKPVAVNGLAKVVVHLGLVPQG